MPTKSICFIHSIKGGCGKSTTALFTVFKEAKKHSGFTVVDEDNILKVKLKPTTCLIDADFRGSSLWDLFHEQSSEGPTGDIGQGALEYDKPAGGLPPNTLHPDYQNKIITRHKNKEQFQYYNRAVIDKAEFYLDDYVTHMYCQNKAPPPLSTPWGIEVSDWQMKMAAPLSIGCDILFCDPSHESKKFFTSNTSKVDGRTIQSAYLLGFFRTMLLELVVKYDNIVIDLSPGLDEYTQCLLTGCFDMAFKKDIDEKIKAMPGGFKAEFILKVIATRDYSHLRSLKDYLADIYAKRKLTQSGPDKVDIVINETNMILEYSTTAPRTPASYKYELEPSDYAGIEIRIRKYLQDKIGNFNPGASLAFTHQPYKGYFRFEECVEPMTDYHPLFVAIADA